MIPSRERAEEILREAAKCNPGVWENHSFLTALCAERIAAACGDMDPEKAYVLGLLHDIKRKFGVSHLKHVYDGYRYMTELGYDEAATTFGPDDYVTMEQFEIMTAKYNGEAPAPYTGVSPNATRGWVASLLVL